MDRRKFLSLSLSALAGLVIRRKDIRQLAPEHLVYQIRVRKGLLGRADITGHLQLDRESSRYSITLWTEEITKKILFIPIARDTEQEAASLVLDPEHLNPLRIRYTVFGRVVDDELVSDAVVVSDKKDGRTLSYLIIRDDYGGGAVVTYSFMGKAPVSRRFGRRPSDPVSALYAISRGRRSVYAVSVSSTGDRFELGGRMLTVSGRGSASVRINTGPDVEGRFWDFKSETRVAFEGNGISRLHVDRYNMFTAIEVERERKEPLQDVGLDRIFCEAPWLRRALEIAGGHCE